MSSTQRSPLGFSAASSCQPFRSIILSLYQRIARKVLSLVPALRSRDEWAAGRWPKHCVATLASLFHSFGEALNMVVLISAPGCSEGLGVLTNVSLRLLTQVSTAGFACSGASDGGWHDG